MNSNQATLNKLEGMRIFGMARAFRSAIETHLKNKFTPDELLSHLIDAEWDDRREETCKVKESCQVPLYCLFRRY